MKNNLVKIALIAGLLNLGAANANDVTHDSKNNAAAEANKLEAQTLDRGSTSVTEAKAMTENMLECRNFEKLDTAAQAAKLVKACYVNNLKSLESAFEAAKNHTPSPGLEAKISQSEKDIQKFSAVVGSNNYWSVNFDRAKADEVAQLNATAVQSLQALLNGLTLGYAAPKTELVAVKK